MGWKNTLYRNFSIFWNLTGYLSKKDAKDYHFIGLIFECLGSVFVDRDDKIITGDSLNMVIEKKILY